MPKYFDWPYCAKKADNFFHQNDVDYKSFFNTSCIYASRECDNWISRLARKRDERNKCMNIVCCTDKSTIVFAGVRGLFIINYRRETLLRARETVKNHHARATKSNTPVLARKH